MHGQTALTGQNHGLNSHTQVSGIHFHLLLGLRSTPTGPAVAAEWVWFWKTAKSNQPQPKPSRHRQGVERGQTCKMQVGHRRKITTLTQKSSYAKFLAA